MSSRSRVRRSWIAAVALSALVVVVGVLAGHAGTSGATAVSAATTPQASTSAPPAPNGSFTLPGGTQSSISSLRGRATMVWFVAGGCASCSVSIPAVGAHLDQLARDGVRVVTIGLWGSFPPGAKGAAAVVAFARAALGRDPVRRDWVWGMSSKALSLAYDPTGYPDSYVLIGPHGHERYENAVPVSTMPELLRAAATLARTH